MSTPALVTVVRPKFTIQEIAGRVLAFVGVLFLRAWLLMLIVGALYPALGLGYWDSMLVILAVAFLLGPRSMTSYTRWTRSSAGKEVEK